MNIKRWPSFRFFVKSLISMTDPTYTRRRERSPRYSRRSPERDRSRRARSRDSYRDRPSDRSEWKRNYDDDKKTARDANTTNERTETRSPPGFPEGYGWNKGDWLCPRPGCEGFVTRAKFDHCINCGRSQPFFKVLTELAKNDKFRVEICTRADCSMRECPMAHAESELRDYSTARIYNKTSEGKSPPSPPVAITEAETQAFIVRWGLQEPATSVVRRLPDSLSELIQRTFYAEVDESDTTTKFLKCLADLIRPRRRDAHRTDQLLGYLADILRRNNYPTGLACSHSGVVAITLEKDVLTVPLTNFSDEHVLGLLAFSLTFNGLTVVHGMSDLANMRKHFPRLYMDLCDSRIRVVDNPSELLYVASDETDAAIDRAVQARVDALNPNPLLPTP